MTTRIIGGGLLLAAGGGDALVEVASLQHMAQAGIGWFWDAYHDAPWPWWPWLVVAHLALAIGIVSGWRPALALGAVVGAVLAAIWAWQAISVGTKIWRITNPEPYLVAIPVLFVAGYIVMIIACLRAVRHADVRRPAE